MPAPKSLTRGPLLKKLKNIRLLALDVDGILTDGRIFWIENQGWTRHFHVQDGYGLKLLMKAGIEVAVISGSDSKDVRARTELLKLRHVFLGDEDKLKAAEKISAATGIPLSQMAFMGDDLFDIPLLEKAGFSATVPHAPDPVKKRTHYVTRHEGGLGAVREIADAIRAAQKLGPT